MVESEGFKKVFRPWLEGNIANSWPDPREVNDKDAFIYRYNVAWGMSQAADQILKFVDDKVAHAEHLEKKEAGEIVDPFEIGGD